MKQAAGGSTQEEVATDMTFAQLSKKDTQIRELCFTCDMKGHREADCPQKQDNASPEQQHSNLQLNREVFGTSWSS